MSIGDTRRAPPLAGAEDEDEDEDEEDDEDEDEDEGAAGGPRRSFFTSSLRPLEIPLLELWLELLLGAAAGDTTAAAQNSLTMREMNTRSAGVPTASKYAGSLMNVFKNAKLGAPALFATYSRTSFAASGPSRASMYAYNFCSESLLVVAIAL
jgi:hypothetical protein